MHAAAVVGSGQTGSHNNLSAYGGSISAEPFYTQLQEKNQPPDSSERSTLTSPSGSFSHQTENDVTDSHLTAGPVCSMEWWRASCLHKREAVRHALEDPSSGAFAAVVHYVVVFSITISTLMAILATCKDLREQHHHLFTLAEEVFTGVFTVEILSRLWVSPTWSAYFCAWSNIVDVVATLPWYFEAGYRALSDPNKGKSDFSHLAGSFRILRVARLIRVVRIAKVARHSETVSLIGESLLASFGGIYVLVAFVGAGTVVAATLVYFVEEDVEGGLFTSLPASMWWALTTITTVGYGDMVPETVLGRLIGSCTMVGGTLIVTLSVAVVTSSFTEQYRHKTEVMKVKKAFLAREHAQANGMSPSQAASQSCGGDGGIMRLVVQRLEHVEQETRSTLAMLKNEIDVMQDRNFKDYRSSFSNHSTLLLVDTLSDQANMFFKAAKNLADSASMVQAISGETESPTAAASQDPPVQGVVVEPKAQNAAGSKDPQDPPSARKLEVIVKGSRN